MPYARLEAGRVQKSRQPADSQRNPSKSGRSPLKARVARFADARGLAEQPVRLVGLAHLTPPQHADLAAR